MSFGLRLAAAFVAVVLVAAVAFGAVGLSAAGSGVNQQVDQFLADRAAELIDGSRGQPSVENLAVAVALDDTTLLEEPEPGPVSSSTSAPDRRDDRDDGHNDRDGSDSGSRSKREPNQPNDPFDPDAIVQVVDTNGQQGASTGPALTVDEVDQAIATTGSPATRYRTIELDGDVYRVLTQAIPEGGAFQVARELSGSNDAIRLIRSDLLLAIPLVAILAGATGVLLARRITKPLRALALSVDQVATTGNLDASIDTAGDDEVARVAAGFDRLLRRLAQSREQQQQLVQDAAHELRTPLTSIRANIDLLTAAPNLDEETRSDSLRSAQRELRELSRLVDEIVEVATDRFAPTADQELDLAAVAADAVARFRLRAPDRRVESSLARSMIAGDALSIGRAVDNLITNADKYSPPDQPIEITVTAEGRLAVIDRGSGIAPEDRQRIFDRFYRSETARQLPGSGLGLAIVASVVEGHGGQFGADDGPDGGTEVWFRIPPLAAVPNK